MIHLARERRVGDILSRNVAHITVASHLKLALASGKKLRVKFGIDPTAPDLHVGHAVVLRKLKEFQNLGHRIVLIIGDYTGRIGDPSERTETRKPLTRAEIKKNMKQYLAQAGKILTIKKTEIRFNSEWLGKKGAETVLKAASAASLQQVLRRADFRKRLDANQDITLLEVLYPVFQGYDSVEVQADVEVGGTDQTFNLLMGRRIQRHFGMKEQDVLTVPLLEGLDGVRKMSKSYKNYIALGDSADEMFGKTMTIPDALIKRYFLLCTELSQNEIEKLSALPPRDRKAKLAYEITALYHGAVAARRAEEHFSRMFTEKKQPANAPSLKIAGKNSVALEIVLMGNRASSRSEAHRLIAQGGLTINKRVITNPKENLLLKRGDIIKIGKRHFYTVR